MSRGQAHTEDIRERTQDFREALFFGELALEFQVRTFFSIQQFQ